MANVVSIHQPHFLPWLGYLDRMQRSDLFVVLDHVQFERQNFQNRVKVKTGQGPAWLVVPVHGGQQDAIVDKRIDNSGTGRHRWGHRLYHTLYHAYRGAPWFSSLAPQLQAVFDEPWERLVDLNLALIQLLRERLEIRTPMVRSSELKVSGHKSELVLSVCQAVSATAFLGGIGGSRRYLDESLFERAGIDVQWQSFQHPRYHQHPQPAAFAPGLSAVDLLFNHGPHSAGVLWGREGRSEAIGSTDPQSWGSSVGGGSSVR